MTSAARGCGMNEPMAMGHVFRESLACECGADWHDHQQDPTQCSSDSTRERNTDTERDGQIVAAWNAGSSQPEIGERFGIQQSWVSKILRRMRADGFVVAEAPQRPHATPGRRAVTERRCVANLERDREIARRREAGETWSEIGDSHGLKAASAKDAAYRLRRRGEIGG